MRKIVLSTAALGAFAAPAFAADLPARAPAPMVAAIYDWGGFYIGANGGWGQSHNCWDFVLVAGPFIRDSCRDQSGGIAGGQIGYRWQASQWVFGLEAQGDWADFSSSRVSLINPAFTTRIKVQGLRLFTGQIGYAWNAALLYFKGGAALTSNRYDILTTLGGVSLASASSTRLGGTVGAGFEYGFAPNWSAGIEYDHLFMGNANNSFAVGNPIVISRLNRISQDVDMVTYGSTSVLVITDFALSPANLSPGIVRGFFCSDRLTLQVPDRSATASYQQSWTGNSGRGRSQYRGPLWVDFAAEVS